MAKYSVIGPFAFRGHAPGKTFEAESDPVIDRAIERGSIREVRTRTKAEPSGEAKTTPASPEKE